MTSGISSELRADRERIVADQRWRYMGSCHRCIRQEKQSIELKSDAVDRCYSPLEDLVISEIERALTSVAGTHLT